MPFAVGFSSIAFNTFCVTLKKCEAAIFKFSAPAIITSREVIMAGALNLKMAASHFFNVTQKVLNAIEENPTAKGTKDATKFG